MTLSTSVLSLLDRHGENLTYTSISSSSYDIDTQTVTPTTATYTVRGYFYQSKLTSFKMVTTVVGQRSLIIPIEDTSGNSLVKPKDGDTFAGVGDSVIVESVREIRDNGSPIFYICTLKE